MGSGMRMVNSGGGGGEVVHHVAGMIMFVRKFKLHQLGSVAFLTPTK